MARPDDLLTAAEATRLIGAINPPALTMAARRGRIPFTWNPSGYQRLYRRADVLKYEQSKIEKRKAKMAESRAKGQQVLG